MSLCIVDTQSLMQFWRSRSDMYRYFSLSKQAKLPPESGCPVSK